MPKMSRVFSQAFKVTAVSRMLAGENVSALARELGVLRKDLYLWRDRFKAGGAEARLSWKGANPAAAHRNRRQPKSGAAGPRRRPAPTWCRRSCNPRRPGRLAH
jgi:transposase-like protein